MPTLPDAIAHWQDTLHWQPSDEQQHHFQRLYEGILQGNTQMNLTRITEPRDFWEKHLWDSLSGLGVWLRADAPLPEGWPTQPDLRAIDIGTGAGFPGLPAAIALPQWHITLLDSTQKKVRFLSELIQTLGVSNARAICDRAEFLAHQPSHREQYDVALLRAVGSAVTCAEYALPLVAIGGVAILYRGQWSEAETVQITEAAHQLGGSLLAVQPFKTPLTKGARHCIVLKKQRRTPDKYPRAVGVPAKQPLGAVVS
ncbi:MAG: 16S rRNA (guanine(527)-N(7))-methyltransferase RsmG [Leptolyngbyaceae cyanobacterium T60_A2020_046]|nr:16S rRNA (guanine(527)-N(7))-methyltransferase RsmG [Leptolyngbyaceae cyanobacterium T60_A2020_046]